MPPRPEACGFRVSNFRIRAQNLPLESSLTPFSRSHSTRPSLLNWKRTRRADGASGAAAPGSLRFRGGLIFKAQRLMCHSTLGSRVTKKKKTPAVPSARYQPNRYPLSSEYGTCKTVKARFALSVLPSRNRTLRAEGASGAAAPGSLQCKRARYQPIRYPLSSEYVR